MMKILSLLLVATALSAVAGCKTDMDCSLNGVCTSAACVCDKPWIGTACTTLAYKVTPASGKNLYNNSDPRNTWNGPIVTGPDGKFHLYDPIYKVGSLGGPTSVLHGVSDVVTGPYDFTKYPDLPAGGENPAFIVYEKVAGGPKSYTFWMGGSVREASSPDGPFTTIKGFTYPGGNPAPLYHNGSFYITNQGTNAVYTTPSLTSGSKWTQYGTINHPTFPGLYRVEDPFMWIDSRGNWHIINHAYRNDQHDNCGSSAASAHWFSTDGKSDWTWSPQPYTHTVQYDDGTNHTYTTLERPNLHFDATGQLTHINLAADLVTGDEGCASRTKHAHNGFTPCDNCKWDDHAGTVIIALDV